MRTIRIAAACTLVALVTVPSWAQDKMATSQAEPAAQDVGGVADTPKGEAGHSMTSTRQSADVSGNWPQAELSRVSSSPFSHH
ncbi:hypothetical protein LMG28727_07076 [Paraburkholderia kirstenboschensis]|nr:hypothetical protein LMG28727_07076 [Paraburkholderia kirstenboschensis]